MMPNSIWGNCQIASRNASITNWSPLWLWKIIDFILIKRSNNSWMYFFTQNKHWPPISGGCSLNQDFELRNNTLVMREKTNKLRHRITWWAFWSPRQDTSLHTRLIPRTIEREFGLCSTHLVDLMVESREREVSLCVSHVVFNTKAGARRAFLWN